jgi:hypothetical protein
VWYRVQCVYPAMNGVVEAISTNGLCHGKLSKRMSQCRKDCIVLCLRRLMLTATHARLQTSAYDGRGTAIPEQYDANQFVASAGVHSLRPCLVWPSPSPRGKSTRRPELLELLGATFTSNGCCDERHPLTHFTSHLHPNTKPASCHTGCRFIHRHLTSSAAPPPPPHLCPTAARSVALSTLLHHYPSVGVAAL